MSSSDYFNILRIDIDTHAADQAIGEFEHLCELNPVFDTICITPRALKFCNSGFSLCDNHFRAHPLIRQSREQLLEMSQDRIPALAEIRESAPIGCVTMVKAPKAFQIFGVVGLNYCRN